ncbi:unnamed protein product, partial [Trichobilharzia regenti]
ETIVAEDKYEPIKISNPDELAKFLEVYPPGDTVEFSELPYPRQLCFSWMVPKIFQAVREYIDLCHRFCENMNLAYTELEDTINRATNFLFSQCLNVVLTSGVQMYSRQLPHLTQFCINLDELETDNQQDGGGGGDSAAAADMSISVTTLNSGANPPRSRLHGASLLKDIRVLVEDQICNHLKDSVAEFINLSNYDDMDENTTNTNTNTTVNHN